MGYHKHAMLLSAFFSVGKLELVNNKIVQNSGPRNSVLCKPWVLTLWKNNELLNRNSNKKPTHLDSCTYSHRVGVSINREIVVLIVKSSCTTDNQKRWKSVIASCLGVYPNFNNLFLIKNANIIMFIVFLYDVDIILYKCVCTIDTLILL